MNKQCVKGLKRTVLLYYIFFKLDYCNTASIQIHDFVELQYYIFKPTQNRP